MVHTKLIADWLFELDKWGLDRTRTIDPGMIEAAIDSAPELWPKDSGGFVDFSMISSTRKNLCEIAILSNQLITNAFIDLDANMSKTAH